MFQSGGKRIQGLPLRILQKILNPQPQDLITGSHRSLLAQTALLGRSPGYELSSSFLFHTFEASTSWVPFPPAIPSLEEIKG